MALSDYYGMQISDGDVVKMHPWSLNGFPESFMTADLVVVGRNEAGILLVVDPTQGEATLVWPETVCVTERDGQPITQNSVEWWANIVHQTITKNTVQAFQWATPFSGFNQDNNLLR